MEILEYCETPIGVLCLRRRELLSSPGTIVTEVTVDHELLMSSYYTASEKALASLALDWHGGANLDVLVGGLGLGYTAHTALECSSVRHVEVVELLPQVISWLSRGLIPLAAALRSEPRLRVEEGDIFDRLRQPAKRPYDVILIDVDHSPEDLLHLRNQSFYTVNGLQLAREHLSTGGVLAVWSSASNESFSQALEQVFTEVKLETICWRNELINRDQRDDVFLARL